MPYGVLQAPTWGSLSKMVFGTKQEQLLCVNTIFEVCNDKIITPHFLYLNIYFQILMNVGSYHIFLWLGSFSGVSKTTFLGGQHIPIFLFLLLELFDVLDFSVFP